MNRVTPSTPMEEILELLETDGYVLLENALSDSSLAAVSAAYDAVLAENPREPGEPKVEVKRMFERGSVFEDLMDHPTVFPIVRQAIGADVELASGGELLCNFPHTPAWISWHNDFQFIRNMPYPMQNYWIRCTYFISDVTPEMGPFTLIPGSHRAEHGPPGEYNDDKGQPRPIEEQVRIVGPAGSCLINNTEIWHTNTPNTSDTARKLLMICYKHAWMKQWQDGYEISPEYAESLTDPLRRQLCGLCTWHRSESEFPAAEYAGSASAN